ncbi:MAG: hypothetical protein HGA44_01895 [Cellulomonadaceae bacterium]|nr:hypothetical protein [Cellulomonadaceae bacterium]
MADPKRLNERQREVLAWIAQGCPPRDWPDFTYKTVAVALQSRGLVVVSKRGGVWSARITEVGRRVHSGVVPNQPAVPRKSAARSGHEPHSDTHPARSNAGQRRAIAQALLTRLVEHGGALELADPTPEERSDLRRAVAAVEESGVAPQGRIVRSSGLTRGRVKIWLAAPSAVDMPVTSRQYDVLVWALNGCSIEDVDVAAFRSAARQLHNRGLLRITGQRSQLTAVITDRGREVLARLEQVIEYRRRAEQLAAEHAAAERQKLAMRQERALALIAEVLSAGGRKELGDRFGPQELHQIEHLSRTQGLAPAGQKLESEPTMMDERLGYTAFLSPDFDAQIAARPAPVPASLRNPSPVAAAFLLRRRRVSKASIPRAARILEAIVEASRARSWATREFDRGYRIAGRNEDDFDLTIDTGELRHHVLIRERNSKNPRDHRAYVSTHWDVYRGVAETQAKLVRSSAFESTGELILELEQHSGQADTRARSWKDTKARTLDEQLPELMRTLDVAQAERDWESQETRRRQELKDARWKQVRATALEAYLYDMHAKRLEDELNRRDAVERMRAYADLVEVRSRDVDARRGAEALAWVGWIRSHAESIDPLEGAVRASPVGGVTDRDLQPYLAGWTPQGPSARGPGW